MTTEQSNTEIEIAFNLLRDPSDISDHPLFQGLDSSQRKLVTVYYDTPGQHLSRAGWSLSLRSSECHNLKKYVQRIKGPTVMAQRPEFEIPIEGDSLDLEKIKATPLGKIMIGHENEIGPMFDTTVERTAYLMHTPSATIEVALDQGTVRSADGRRRAPINDLELEKKSGSIGALFRVAVRLALDLRIMIEPASKAERGFALINNTQPSSQRHADMVLSTDLTIYACIRTIVNDALTHVLNNLKSAYAGQPEGIHQLRVAIRRMRAALFMFRRFFNRETVTAFDNELKRFSRVFGEARDWDVFVTQTLPKVSAAAELDWPALVQPLAVRRQQQAHEKVRDALASQSFNSLILALMAWIEDGVLHNGQARFERPVRNVLPGLLSALDDRVSVRARKLGHSDEAMHALRKAMKTLRYGVEFVASQFPTKEVKRFVGPCKDLQEALGTINDAGVTEALMAQIIAEQAAVAPANAYLEHWLDGGRQRAEDNVPKLIRRLRDDAPFWE